MLRGKDEAYPWPGGGEESELSADMVDTGEAEVGNAARESGFEIAVVVGEGRTAIVTVEASNSVFRASDEAAAPFELVSMVGTEFDHAPSDGESATRACAELDWNESSD